MPDNTAFISLSYDTYIDFNSDGYIYYYNDIFTIKMTKDEFDKLMYKYSFDKMRRNDIINPYE